MKKVLFAPILVLLIAGTSLTSFAQNPFFKLDSLYQKGLVSSDQFILNKFYFQFNRAMANPAYFRPGDEPVYCTTPLYSDFKRLKENNLISQSTIQAIQNMDGSKYILDQLEKSYTTEHFKIHYSITPGNPYKIPDQYIDGQVPTLIPLIGQFAEEIFLKYQQIGFQMPIDLPGTQLGDGKYNIGIDGTGDYCGTTAIVPNNVFVGEELSCIELPLKGDQYLNNDNPNKFHGMLMYSIAHEFKHAIQLTYDIERFYSRKQSYDELDADGSIEAVLDDNNFVYYGYSPNFQNYSNGGIKLNINGYSEWIWHQFLSEYIHGPNSIHPDVLVAINSFAANTENDFYSVYDSAITTTTNNTKNLTDAIYSFWCWNLLTGADLTVTNFGYEESPKIKPMTLTGTINTLPTEFEYYGIKPTACLYYKIPVSLFSGGYKLKLKFSSSVPSDPDKKVKLFYAGIKNHLLSLTEVAQNTDTYLTTDYDQIFLIVINGDYSSENQRIFSVSMEKYGIPLQFSNKILTESVGGDLLIETINLQLQSGDTQVLFDGENHRVKTLLTNVTIPSKPGIIHGRHHWNTDFTQFKTLNDFSVSLNNNQTAQFQAISQIGLNIAFDGIQSTEPSFTSFIQDPWTSQNQTEFLPASGSKEVFLGEALDPQKPLKPYYQLKTDRIKTGTGSLAGLNLSFQNWSSTGTEPLIQSQTEAQPVVFTAAGATVTANYKAMLASKTAGWVTGNQFASVNGTGSVFYKSDNKLWLHKEDGTTQTEIMITDPADLLTPRSVTQSGTNRFIIYQTNAGDHWFEQVGSSVNFSTNLSLPVAGRTPVSVFRLHDPAVKPNPVLVFMYMEGTRVRFQCTELNGDVLPAGPVFSSWFQSELSGMLTSSTQVQRVGNGNVVYLVWLYNGKIYSQRYRRGNTDFANSAPTLIYTSSSGNYLSFSAAVTPTHDLSLLLNRKEAGVNNNKTTGTGKWYYNGSVQPYTVLETTTQFVSVKGLSSEGTKLLTAIGKSSDQESWSYFLWKFNGTDWIKETTSFSSFTPDLLPGEVDFRPSETAHPSGLKLMTLNSVNWPPPGANKITTGTNEQPVLSISGVQLTDTLVYNVNTDPAIVDSIIIDTLGVWSIAVKGSGFVTEIVNDLKLFGTSELIVSSSEAGTSRTIEFIPNLVKWDVWVVDPSGNKVRMGKENRDEELGSESIQTEVAVYPNPFNPETRINIRLAEPGELKVKVYNVVGQLVADLANGHHYSGDYSFRFDGKNLASGTYFYRVEIGTEVKTGKLKLLK